ncbi:MAG: hypothetical protein Q8L07_13250 [Sediminibacterium sp.]|nr:hypothetical protein [Sediminibacterium sp.]MDP1810873.1 hypothetical protein [Sediminibacterium sp.]MDP3129135.1 hypothetical protein [Sediminibacterium sp.]MDP3665920.1 hypothetical protein [Sediminibacterium sp.]
MINKVTFLIVLIFSVAEVNAMATKDTSFLAKEFLNGAYHVVFIDHNRQSAFYKQIQNLIPLDTVLYNKTLNELYSGGSKPNTKFQSIGIDRDWYSLHQYKGKYFAYAPSEPYYNIWLRITDSTVLLNYFNDGVLPAIIKNSKWENNNLVIETISKYETDTIIKIHVINSAKGIAILEFPKRPNESKYSLIVSSRRIRNFPIIVNYCAEQRAAEWKFDDPNFINLLNKNAKFFNR